MIDAQQLQDTIHAAKAAGLPPIVYMEGIGTGYWPERGDFVTWPYEARQYVELAGALGLVVGFGACAAYAGALMDDGQRLKLSENYADHAGSKAQAAERAIFRVAVAIGRGMP